MSSGGRLFGVKFFFSNYIFVFRIKSVCIFVHIQDLVPSFAFRYFYVFNLLFLCFILAVSN